MASEMPDRVWVSRSEERARKRVLYVYGSDRMARAGPPDLERTQYIRDDLVTARDTEIARLKALLSACTDEHAEVVALDMDHANRDHSRWWKCVLAARGALAIKEVADGK